MILKHPNANIHVKRDKNGFGFPAVTHFFLSYLHFYIIFGQNKLTAVMLDLGNSIAHITLIAVNVDNQVR